MAKTLNFTYKDKEYTLEFTRRTVSEMERRALRRRISPRRLCPPCRSFSRAPFSPITAF